MAVALNNAISEPFPVNSPIKCDVNVEYSPLLLLNVSFTSEITITDYWQYSVLIKEMR